MQLARFRLFVREVRHSDVVKTQTKTLFLYRLYSGTWFDEADTPVADQTLTKDLARTLDRGEHWRHPKCVPAYFPVPSFSAVVRATYPSASTKPTRDKLHRELELCEERSAHRFDATHDILTGLLNSQEFEREAANALASISTEQELEEGVAGAEAPSHGVSLVALDVDHFKQVNDTYGHIYGDIVLQCLARRLESTAAALAAESKGDLTAYVARPGGEEFLILLSGAIDPDRTKSLAESFRHAIAKDPLPTDQEWISLSKKDSAVHLPPLPDRQVTVSVGAATATVGESISTIDPVRHLMIQADKALYCAKSGGRNTVRHFGDILSRYGAVLEHDLDTGVVVIDIGKEVNVRNGQEFLVYHPRFTGNVPFVQDDGRSRRTLGTYPRVPIGRLVVFDAQQEISFCRVADQRCAGPFPQRAPLQAVPLGTISHLVEDQAGLPLARTLQLASASDLRSRLVAASEADEKIATAIFGISNASSLAEERGSAFINHCLARLYEIIRDKFPTGAEIAQLEGTQLGVTYIGKDVTFISAQCARVLGEVSEKVAHIADFCTGIYLPDHEWKIDDDQSALDNKHALEYAQYAVAVALGRGKGIEIFTPRTAVSILGAARRGRKFDQGLKDYSRLRELGIQNAVVENLAAFSRLRSPTGILNWLLPRSGGRSN